MTRAFRYSAASPAVLRQNAKHGFAARHALCHYGSDTVYSFIPKNGCSTMRLSLAVANGCIADEQDWLWIHANNETFRASLRELARARFTFVILRCPFSRLASAFLDKIVSRKPDFWELHRAEGERFDPASLSFRGFVKLLQKPGHLRRNLHWAPQSDFLVYKDYDFWGALESFDAAKQKIEMETGMTILDARPWTAHGTSGGEVVEAQNFADMTLHRLEGLKIDGRLPPHAQLYDAQLRESVARLYADDLKLYIERLGRERLTFPDIEIP
ncbi:MAG: sulfotransferase family 2 domain-containing protein [Rhodobacteraceae bacterium]|nr:sulfotransferase family 2 domain-containing protein [Paracoccaceae bacterium]